MRISNSLRIVCSDRRIACAFVANSIARHWSGIKDGNVLA